MIISVITLFPNLFDPFFSTSIIGRATTRGFVTYNIVDLRAFGEGKHKTVDDRPYGGGPGMILKPDVLAKAWKSIKSETKPHTILMSASGHLYNQKKASELSKYKHLILVCGHYEGVDQRFVNKYVDEEISIGDYVLTGGELPALVVIDSVVRLIPGVLSKDEATTDESFSPSLRGLLEYPQYTRPADFEGLKIPKILKSGNHQKIMRWRTQKSIEKTKKIRPDLMKEK